MPPLYFISYFRKYPCSVRVNYPINSTSLKKCQTFTKEHTIFDIKWKIIQRAKSYKSGDQECRLCILEIYHIYLIPQNQLSTADKNWQTNADIRTNSSCAIFSFLFQNLVLCILLLIVILQISSDLKIGLFYIGYETSCSPELINFSVNPFLLLYSSPISLGRALFPELGWNKIW